MFVSGQLIPKLGLILILNISLPQVFGMRRAAPMDQILHVV